MAKHLQFAKFGLLWAKLWHFQKSNVLTSLLQMFNTFFGRGNFYFLYIAITWPKIIQTSHVGGVLESSGPPLAWCILGWEIEENEGLKDSVANCILIDIFSEYFTLHSEPNQTSLTCLPEVPVWQCCYWSVAAPPTSGRPAGPGCSSAGLNSKCVFIWTSTSKYWALAPHLALWQQNWEQYDCYYATWIIAPLKVKFIDSKIDVA